jgi:DNA helicase-2/ATP-dependent DNA helicase PcrA
LDDSLISESKWSIRNSEKMLQPAPDGISFRPGSRIVHSIMGPGEVLDIDRDQAAYVIKFDDLATLRKISFKANLAAEG